MHKLLRTLSAANTTGINAKGSAAVLYGAVLGNNSATADAYVKLYDKAVAPTVGTDTPVMTLYVPKGTAQHFTFGPDGVAFLLGLGLGITGALADADTTAPAANQVVVNLEYL